MPLRAPVLLLTAPFWLLVWMFLPARAVQKDPPVKVVVVEATYVMGDADTLAGAEEHALLRAKRKAIEEAGVYLEAASEDIERYVNGQTSRFNWLGIRTIASAITKTEILDKRRTLEGDRLTFYVKIAASVELETLDLAVKRLKSDEQLAEHHRRLQEENNELRAQMDRFRKSGFPPPGHGTTPVSGADPHRRAAESFKAAVQTQDVARKLELLSQAIAGDPTLTDAYIVRGQTYLRLAALARATQHQAPGVNRHVESAAADFRQALALNPTSTWALLGQGDAKTWQHDVRNAATDYEQILSLDPSFEIARERLIKLHTTEAKQQMARKRWHHALLLLHKIIEEDAPDSWSAQKTEAYLMRSQVHLALGDLQRAVADLSTVLRTEPSHRDALLKRATLYRKLKLGRQAKDDLDEACRLGAPEACEPGP
jgi:tetratricopeptide (TPR) repeat protein